MGFYVQASGVWHIHAKTPRGTAAPEQLPNSFLQVTTAQYCAYFTIPPLCLIIKPSKEKNNQNIKKRRNLS